MYDKTSISLLCDAAGDVKSVMRGDSVTLDTDVPELQSDDLIEWIYGNKKVIAKFCRKENTFLSHVDVNDELFRDRLQVDDQTGSLTITDITTDHSGLYQLRISTRAKLKISSQFRVIVTGKHQGLNFSFTFYFCPTTKKCIQVCPRLK